MAKIIVNEIVDNMKSYLSILSPSQLVNTGYSTIVNSARYGNAWGISKLKREEEDIRKANNCISKAIKYMKEKDIPLRIDNYIFALGYPHSIKYIDTYYETLYEICSKKDNFIGAKGIKPRPFNNNLELLKKKIEFMRQATYTIFVPLYRDKGIKTVKEEYGFDKELFKKIIKKYDSLSIANKVINEDIITKDAYNLIMEGKTLEDTAKDIGISVSYVRSLLKSYLNEKEYEKIEKILSNNSIRRFEHMKSLYYSMLNYLFKGIPIDGIKEHFTILDYFSMTGLSVQEMNGFLNDLRRTCNEDEKVNYSINKIKEFFDINKNLGGYVNKRSANYDNAKVENNNGVFYLKEYVDEIYEVFRENNIPMYKKLFDLALYRIANNIPILPLKEMNKEKKEGEITI